MSCRSASMLAVHSVIAAMLLVAAPVGAIPPAGEVDERLDVSESARTEPRYFPTPEEFTGPGEQAILTAIAQSLADPAAPQKALPALDEALGKLQRPSKLRGVVQFMRSGLLIANSRESDAIDAIEESIRLLPGYSAPLLSAASTYAYANQPGKGTDYFLRAAEVDPKGVRKVDDYEVDNLIRRLKVARDDRRARMLSDRLLEIGWIGSSLRSRSNLARTAIEQRIDDGKIDDAKALIPKLVVPGHSYDLLMDRKYSAIWPDLEAWAGPRLEGQWATYLREARDRWTPSKDVVATRDYLAALRAAGHDRTTIRDILPLFDRKLDPVRVNELQFVVAGVANALAHEGRWNDVQALFAKAQAVWPLQQKNPNSLNIAANWASYLLYEGKYEQALEKMEVALDLARQWEVNPDAIGQMYAYRACALHQMKRDSEAGVSIAIASAVGFPNDLAYLHLCTGNRDAARRALLDGLKSETGRGRVLAFMQKTSSRAVDSDYGRRLRIEVDSLKADPEILAEVQTYGRILPYSEGDGAPAEASGQR